MFRTRRILFELIMEFNRKLNATLNQMAEQQPTNRRDFAKLSGVGTKKLEQYADDFIAIILEHHQKYPPAEPPTELSKSTKTTQEPVTSISKLSKRSINLFYSFFDFSISAVSLSTVFDNSTQLALVFSID